MHKKYFLLQTYVPTVLNIHYIPAVVSIVFHYYSPGKHYFHLIPLFYAEVEFIIQPHKRFVGQPGEQWTMFFKDPSGNNLEFKAVTNPSYLFAKYNVQS